MLATINAADLGDSVRLATLSRLRTKLDTAQAAAVYETALLRRRGAAKFRRAAAMYFTREALEQASGETIAHYRARRFTPYQTVGDLCCGIGGDTLALAQTAQVIAVDYDKLRLAMAVENTRAYGLAEQVRHSYADLEQTLPPVAEALFFDPARRNAGKRVYTLDAYLPSLRHLGHWRERTPAIGIKISPGVQDEELAALPTHEVEFISVDGELKEAVLWFGPLGIPGRRATLLAQGLEAEGWKLSEPPPTLHTGAPRSGTRVSEPLAFLYEPDPAVIRAHQVVEVAELLGAAQLDPSIAYLTSDQQQATPFARCWRIIEWVPFNLKRLRARLHALDAGAVTVKKRGSPLDTDQFARQLSGQGKQPLVVVFTKLRGAPIALICVGPV